jgi:hypothetical protein
MVPPRLREQRPIDRSARCPRITLRYMGATLAATRWPSVPTSTARVCFIPCASVSSATCRDDWPTARGRLRRSGSQRRARCPLHRSAGRGGIGTLTQPPARRRCGTRRSATPASAGAARLARRRLLAGRRRRRAAVERDGGTFRPCRRSGARRASRRAARSLRQRVGGIHRRRACRCSRNSARCRTRRGSFVRGAAARCIAPATICRKRSASDWALPRPRCNAPTPITSTWIPRQLGNIGR